MRFSFFSNFFDNQAQPSECASWDEFVKIMYAMSKVEGYKPAAGDYESKSSPLISSGIYNPEIIKRCNNNILGWEMIMLDIDAGVDDINDVTNHFSVFNYIIYSSPNCTADQLKLRVIIPLNEFAPFEVLNQIWHASEEWCNKLVDPQTKDKSRMMYVPAMYTNRGDKYTHFFLVNRGINLNWEGLVAKYPSPPEKDRFKVNNPLNKLKQKIYKSNNPLPSFDIQDPNCPFVYGDMIKDYLLTMAGGHHRAIYVFMLKICGAAEKLGYPLSHDELVDMASQMDALDGGFYDTKKLADSAQDALEYSNL